MTIKLIAAFVLALIISTCFGRVYIPWLIKEKAGQEIKEIGPSWHMAKSGTPTMGGVMFILATGIVISIFGILSHDIVNLAIFVFALFYAAIGFLDDWEKIKKKQNLGLSAKAKFVLQLAAAFVFLYFMRRHGYLSHELYFPFINKSIYIPGWFYYPFLAFVIVGTVNAVNITDGIDGLAASTTIPVLLFFVAGACVGAHNQVGIFASALIGGLVGFLFYNFNPAKVFMGDTGSLFLGGVVIGLAITLDMPLVMVTLGIMYIIETLSDIIQVGYFKLSHGKRVFKMAPFHHHLELGGWLGHKWKEKEIVALFVGITIFFSIITFFGAYQKF